MVARLTAATVLATLAMVVTPSAPARAVTTVTTAAELNSAFAAGGAVALGADISVGPDGPAINVQAGESVRLDLKGHDLTVQGGKDAAGIAVPRGASLTIVDGSSTGSLTARGGNSPTHDPAGGPGGAGIGGGRYGDSGTITVGGGTVIAIGSIEAAGIGGGASGDSDTVVVDGGTVTARTTAGGDLQAGAGIGGGFRGNSGTIIINDGTVNAVGSAGAGLGGGYDGESDTITINGGTVNATSSNGGAAIGGGRMGGSGTITINDGTITANSNQGGAAIGSGSGGGGLVLTFPEVGDITINGGTVTADADGHDTFAGGAGIGGGDFSIDGEITITGGTVTSDGGNGANGIGVWAGNLEAITITGGTVTARGGVLVDNGRASAGAGIGVGDDGRGDRDGIVEITGGTVEAIGGSAGGTGGPVDGGAGIGGAGGYPGMTVAIDDATVTATGGTGAAGIGAGMDDDSPTYVGDGAHVSIGEGADVTASSASGIAVGPSSDARDFGSLSNAGTLRIPAGQRITIPATETVTNSGLLTGGGAIENHGAILTSDGTVDVVDAGGGLTVTDHHFLVSFDADGGTWSSGEPDPVRVFAGSFDAAGLQLPAGPTRPGYRFAGWFRDQPVTAAAPLTSPDGPAEVPRAVPVHARWEALPPTITTSDLPAGEVSAPYAIDLAATGATGDYRWALTDGTLPSGLTLDPDTGRLTGTPTEDGDHALTVAVTDANGGSDSRTLDLRIAAELVVATTDLPTGTVGQPYRARLTATGGVDTDHHWTLADRTLRRTTDDTLPSGLTLGDDGTITGVPTEDGTYPFTATVNGRADQQLTLTVHPPSPADTGGASESPQSATPTPAAPDSLPAAGADPALYPAMLIAFGLLVAGGVLLRRSRRS